MCGIAGIFDPGRRVDPSTAERMALAIAHRGPDSAGSFSDGPCALAFRRLAIIDLQTGDQPISSEDGSLWLICNGEIYDHIAHRRSLEARGHAFRTGSDAEVLLHLYEEHGDALFDHIEGQFAFALYDRRRERLLLGRDRFGICPLFWARVGTALIFASEVKALLAHPALPRRVDLAGLDAVLCFPGLVGPLTMVEGVHSLEAGHALSVDQRGVNGFRHHDLSYPLASEHRDDLSEEDHVAALEAELDAAVRRRLQADVPVGVYLSGGLDSSLVAALAARHAPGIASFSVTFDDPGLDESRFQRMVAGACGLDHHEVRFDAASVAPRLADVVRFSECPVKETYNACSLALAEAARQAGVRAVLGGEGADELFGGYAGYRLDLFRQGPSGAAVGNGQSALEQALEAELNERLWGAPLRYEKDLLAHRSLRAELYAPAVSGLLPSFDCTRRALVDTTMVRGRHPLHQRSYLDIKLRMADHLLGDHGDRMAMARGVEPRFPFLDGAVVEHARTMRPELKLQGYREKHIVKRVAGRLLPAAVAEREKFGFHAPGSPALLQAGLPWVFELLSRERIARDGYWSEDAIAYLVERNAQPGFRLDLPFEEDVLLVVLTFNMLIDQLGLQAIS